MPFSKSVKLFYHCFIILPLYYHILSKTLTCILPVLLYHRCLYIIKSESLCFKSISLSCSDCTLPIVSVFKFNYAIPLLSYSPGDMFSFSAFVLLGIIILIFLIISFSFLIFILKFIMLALESLLVQLNILFILIWLPDNFFSCTSYNFPHYNG